MVVVEDDDSVVSSAIDSGLNLLIDKVEILDFGDIKAVVEKICSMITAMVNRTVEQSMIRMYNS